MPKYCSYCGKQIQDGAKFCIGCGKPVQDTPRYCFKCGKQIQEGAEYCTGCGQRVNIQPAYPDRGKHAANANPGREEYISNANPPGQEHAANANPGREKYTVNPYPAGYDHKSGNDHKKRNKKKRANSLIPIMAAICAVLFVIVIGLGTVLFLRSRSGKTTNNSGSAEAGGSADEAYYKQSDLVLYITDNNLNKGEDGTLEVTVLVQNDSISDAIDITDENGDHMGTFENDGSGCLKGNITVDTEEERCGSLTAASGDYESTAVKYYVTPEITDEMVQTLYDVTEDLSIYISEQDFKDYTSKSTLKKIKEYLDDDDRIAAYIENNGAIFYQTQDQLIGCWFPEDPDEARRCVGGSETTSGSTSGTTSGSNADSAAGSIASAKATLSRVASSISESKTETTDTSSISESKTETTTSSSGMPNYITEKELYEKWKKEEDTSNDYLYAKYQTSDKLLYTAFDMEDSVIKTGTPYYTDVLENISLEREMNFDSNLQDNEALAVLRNGEFTEYAFWEFFAHGSQSIRKDKTYMWWGSLGTVTKKTNDQMTSEIGKSYYELLWGELFIKYVDTKKGKEISASEVADYSKEDKKHVDALVNCPDKFQMAYEAKGDGTVDIRISSNYFASVLGNKQFDNTFIFFCSCYGYSDPDLYYLFEKHGASGFLSSVPTVDTACAYQALLEYEDYMTDYQELVTDNCTLSDYYTHITPSYMLSNQHDEVMEEEKAQNQAANREEYTEADYKKGVNEHPISVNGSSREDFYFGGLAEVHGTVKYQNSDETLPNAKLTFYRWVNHEFREVDEEDLTNVYTDENGEFYEELEYGYYIIKAEGHSETYCSDVEATGYISVDKFDMEDQKIEIFIPPYYEWIRDNMLTKLGYADNQAQTRTLYASQMSGSGWAANSCWDNRYGLAGANIADLNADKIPDCVVYYYAKDENHGFNNSSTHPIGLYMTLLTYDPENDQIVELNTTEISYFTNNCFAKVRTGVIKIQDQYYLYAEDNSNSYFADGGGADYTFYTYDGTQLRPQWMVGKSGGGSDQIIYSLYTYSDAEHYTDEKIACFYGNISGTTLGCDTVQIQDALIYGFHKIGLEDPAIENYVDSGWGATYPYNDTFPTYWNKEGFHKGVEYTCSGSGDYSVRNMTVISSDQTGLQEHIEALDD